MVSCKSNDREKTSPTAVDALRVPESREIDGRVGDETSLRPRPRACMLGALRRAKQCFADSGFALSSAASVGRTVNGQLTLSISRLFLIREGRHNKGRPSSSARGAP